MKTLAFMLLRKLGLETFILRSGSRFDLEKFSIKKMFEDMYLNTLYKASRGLRLRNIMAACCTKFDRTRDDTCINSVNFLGPDLFI